MACWFSDIKSPKWPGGNPLFKFNRTTVLSLEESILLFAPKTTILAKLKVARTGSKGSGNVLLGVIVRGVAHISTLVPSFMHSGYGGNNAMQWSLI